MDSFNQLFKKYKEPFISFANSYLHDRVAAEDIYTDAMVQYWEKRNELSSDVNVPAYILTIVKNMALNHLRHLHVRDQVEDEIANHRLRELNFRISSLEACEPMELFACEIRDIIRNTLDELPEQTRIVFFKSRFEHKKNKEISEDLNVSIKTVEYHISKALKLLHVRLKDYLPILYLLFTSHYR